MKTRTLIFGAIAAAILLPAATLAAQATSGRTPAGDGGAVLVAAADCYAVGQRIAQQHGGQLANATPVESGGRTMCAVVVLVPGQAGERPRRIEVTVPAG